MQSYKDKLFIFGGMLKSNKLKTLTSDVSVYNSSNSIKQYFIN